MLRAEETRFTILLLCCSWISINKGTIIFLETSVLECTIRVLMPDAITLAFILLQKVVLNTCLLTVQGKHFGSANGVQTWGL